MTSVLGRVHSPADLRALDHEELALLASEIRDLLVQTVSRTGGHLGPNLGAVELTIALHRVFDSPTEPILFDVGHQAYVHKILTGRADAMRHAAPDRGLSGLPEPRRERRTTGSRTRTRRQHCPTPTVWRRRSRCATRRRPVVAVVGDGALTGGMCMGGAEQHRGR